MNEASSTTTQWNYDFANQQIITTVAPGISYADSGGKTHIGRYTGTFFDRPNPRCRTNCVSSLTSAERER